MKIARLPIELIALAVVMAVSVLLVLRVPPARQDTVLASYSTDLAGRTPHQRYNARRAAAALDGVVVKPGATFSFDKIVKGWTGDQGFLRAPVSYNGTLIDDYGGGVCETSTTIYNAALLAGLQIVERHSHSFSPSYAPPGRDAAVAYPSADLRFVNTYPWTITLHVRPWGNRLVCQIQALHNTQAKVLLYSRILGRTPPSDAPVTPGAGMRRTRWQLRGRDGLRVAIFRSWYENGAEIKTEEISDDTYLPISRVAWEQ